MKIPIIATLLASAMLLSAPLLQAQTPCTQCETDLDNCISAATDDWDDCTDDCDWEEWQCELEAYDTYEWCLEHGGPEMEQYCESQLSDDLYICGAEHDQCYWPCDNDRDAAYAICTWNYYLCLFGCVP